MIGLKHQEYLHLFFGVPRDVVSRRSCRWRGCHCPLNNIIMGHCCGRIQWFWAGSGLRSRVFPPASFIAHCFVFGYATQFLYLLYEIRNDSVALQSVISVSESRCLPARAYIAFLQEHLSYHKHTCAMYQKVASISRAGWSWPQGRIFPTMSRSLNFSFFAVAAARLTIENTECDLAQFIGSFDCERAKSADYRAVAGSRKDPHPLPQTLKITSKKFFARFARVHFHFPTLCSLYWERIEMYNGMYTVTPRTTDSQTLTKNTDHSPMASINTRPWPPMTEKINNEK